MSGAREMLSAVAGAVADGLPIDWAKAESTPMTQAERTLLAELRLLEELHRLHRFGESPTSAVREAETRAQNEAVVVTAQPAAEDNTNAVTETHDALQTWGSLEIRGMLGAGGFGVVYRAWDPLLATEVALKVLRHDATVGPSVIEEARLLARVRHPNIVSIYGADRWNGEVGLWMELVRGRTLKQVLKERGAFGAREAALVGLDLTRALAAVHGAGLVHRDVKPHNVMREDGGRIVLMDFGAGVEWEELTSGPLRKYAGTPLYMAPELFDHRHPTPQSDLYSLGVLLYHVVTGAYPLDGSSPADVQAAHQRGERRRLRDVRPDLPTEFVRIVERAIDPDDANRYRSAGELEADLAQFVVGDQRRAERRATDASIAEKRRRSYRVGIVVALAAIVLLAASVAIFQPWRRTPPPSAASLRSLAVLPLRNMSGDPAQDYFVDGMTELLTANLSGVSSLRVISDTSAMTYRGTKKPISTIGRELNVDGVVEGSVTRSGDRVRVTLQLVHAGTNLSVWGDSYEREASDAFRLQAEIARTLVEKLRAALTPAERNRLQRTYAANPQAQDLYLRGRYLLHTFNRDRLREARTLFERAVAIDPDYALAWASLARCYTLLGFWGVVAPAEARTLATEAARQALAHDDAMFEAHTAMAEVLFKFDWDWAASDLHYRQAIAANPNFSLARSQYARFLSAAGRVGDAVAQARRAEEEDPLSTDVKSTVAMMLFYQRQYREAAEKAGEAIALDRTQPGPHIVRGRALAGLRRFDEAIREVEEAVRLSAHPGQLAELGRVYAVAGRRADAEAILAKLSGDPADGFVAAQDAAYIQAALGRYDEALAGLERGVDQRSERILWLRVDPRVDSLRDQPRFVALLGRIGDLPAVRQ